MPDEITHDIYHVDEPEGYDALQEVTTELEQGEAESDDLMKRLDSLHKQATVERSHFYVGSCAKDAMHRIEELEAKKYHDAWLEVEIVELEAKLAKAVEALGRISSGEFSGQVLTSMPPQDAAVFFARTTLAELKGQE